MAKKKSSIATKTKTTKKVAKKGKAKVTTTTVVTTTTTTEVPVQTRVAFVVDASSSMHGLEDDVIRMFNKLLSDIRSNDPTAEFTMVTFADEPTVKLENVGLSQIRELNRNTYQPGGNTALFDGVARALEVMGDSKDKAFLVYVITDGEENASDMAASTFEKLVKSKQATDRYTIVFQLPMGKKNAFVNLSGVYPGNVQEWETSARGLGIMTHNNTASVGTYYATRAAGQAATRSFFDVNLSGVTTKDFNKLQDVTGQFRILSVDKDIDIKSFAEEKGLTFRVGAGYYNLTKKETIADHKNLLLTKSGEKEIRAGSQEIRDLIGLPQTGDAKANPKNLNGYDLFIQSTSNNRRLVRGSRLLWEK